LENYRKLIKFISQAMEILKEGIEPKEVSSPAESFEVEFLNMKSPDVVSAMASMGDFSFRRSGSEEGDKVFFEGERPDGTKIRIEIEKGSSYKSPAEIANEESQKEA
jgi:hypothetical protein